MVVGEDGDLCKINTKEKDKGYDGMVRDTCGRLRNVRTNIKKKN